MPYCKCINNQYKYDIIQIGNVYEYTILCIEPHPEIYEIETCTNYYLTLKYSEFISDFKPLHRKEKLERILCHTVNV